MQTTGIPDVIPFEEIRGHQTVDCFWESVGRRPPKKGEYYVSGALPMAYKARGDLSTAYTIVVPTHFARRVTTWAKGEPIPRQRPNREDATWTA